MNLLEGSIAFALALAGLATLCTVLVEIFHRALGLRSQGLRVLLGACFERHLQAAAGAKTAEAKAAFIAQMTDSALLAHLESGRLRLPAFIRRRLLTKDTMSRAEFVGRLEDSEQFQALLAKLGKTKEDVLRELGEDFDRFSNSASDYFKARAHFLSLLVGIFFALFGNIHAGRIFDNFIRNPEVAQQMQAQAGAIRSALQAANAAADKPLDAGQIHSALENVQTTLDDYRQLGLAVGWDYYPNCPARQAGDARCLPLAGKDAGTPADLRHNLWRTLANDPLGFVTWLVVVLLTGCLIGLGGPFWYDLAMRLSQVRQAFTGKAALPPADAGASPAGGQGASG